MSGMGILVYMAHLGYEHEKENKERKRADEARLKEKVDADLGAHADSFAEIPSVS